jgi:hypothetical protein
MRTLSVNSVLGKVLIGVAGAAGAVILGFPGLAGADPSAPPPPPLPNVNALAPVSPVDYAAMGDRYYAFTTADGLICAIDRTNGAYGCSGALPNAPGGANVVSGPARGAPGFASTAAPLFANIGPVKPLPANTRLSYRNISCTTDGGATTMCVNAQDQTGFVLSPAGSYVLDTNPLVARPEGTNPYAN